MPLVATREAMSETSSPPESVVLLMQVDHSDPPHIVRVIATRECLRSLDPTGGPTDQGYPDVAKGNSMRIEAAASRKFDREGLNSEGEIVLGSSDFP